ncbi:MAG: hypothetical protein HYZ27_01770 [Deltaproteobacteria bacterium]|nr:hypothetical protein [Deltaproteobacteria bacterium]
MMRFVVVTCVWACAAAAAAEEVGAVSTDKIQSVAVLELKATGLDANVVKNLTELFTAEAGKVPGYKVIGQSEIKDMLGFEIEKQQMGCDDASCYAQIGGALGVDLLVTGSVGTVGETFVVNARLIDIGKAQTRNRVAESIAGRVELLPDYMRVVAWRVMGQEVPKAVSDAYEATRARLAAPAAAAVTAPAETGKAEVAATTEPQRMPMGWRVARTGTAALAGVGLVGGGAMHALSYMKNNEADSEDDSGKKNDLKDTADRYQKLAYTGYIIGGAGAIAHLLVRFFQPHPDAPTALQIIPTPNGVLVKF